MANSVMTETDTLEKSITRKENTANNSETATRQRYYKDNEANFVKGDMLTYIEPGSLSDGSMKLDGINPPMPRVIGFRTDDDLKWDKAKTVATCSCCGKTVTKDDESIKSHKVFHDIMHTLTAEGPLYVNKDEVKATINYCKKMAYKNGTTDIELQYLIYYWLTAIYSRHIIASIDVGKTTFINRKGYIRDYILTYPEEFPRKVIPYMLRVYCNRESSFIANNWYNLGKVREFDDWSGWNKGDKNEKESNYGSITEILKKS